MGWSEDFIAWISGRGPYYPRFTLTNLPVPGFSLQGSDLYASSHREPGYSALLTPRGNSFSAGAVNLRDWSSSQAQLTLGFRSAVDIRRQIARGQLLQLRMGPSDWPVGEYEPIFTGLVSGIDRSGQDWSITLDSATKVPLSRLSDAAAEVTPFYLLQETELSADYNAGDPDLEVVDDTGANTDNGGKYLVEVTDDDGDAFYLTATGLDPGPKFTGVSATGRFGTTAATATSGNRVRICAFVEDDPVSAARKFLLSTGLAINGQWDTLPGSWAAGLPQDALDDDDCDNTALIVAPSGDTSKKWAIRVTEPQDDGLSWFQSVFGPAGIFLTERQGRVTVRAITNPNDLNVGATTIITDTELVRIDSYATWDPSAPVEYGQIRYKTPTDNTAHQTTEQIDSKPAVERQIVRLDNIQDNLSDWRQSVAGRLDDWWTRLPEVLEVTCRGWRLAQLAAGDHVLIDSKYFVSRTGIVEARFIALMVQPDWWGCSVRLRLAHVPITSAEW